MMMRAYAIWGQGRNVLIFLVALNLVRIRSTYIQLLVVIINIIQGVIIPDIILLQRSLKSLVCQFKCSYFGFAQREKLISMIFIAVMPSPFPTLAPCVLASADNSVFVDFILIMVSESGKQQ